MISSRFSCITSSVPTIASPQPKFRAGIRTEFRGLAASLHRGLIASSIRRATAKFAAVLLFHTSTAVDQSCARSHITPYPSVSLQLGSIRQAALAPITKTQSHKHIRSVCGAFGNPGCLQGRVPSLWRSACCTPVALWLRLPSPTTTGRHVTCLTAQGDAQNSLVGGLAEVDSARVADQRLS